MTVVSPNDEVLIPAPYWTSYPDMVKICNAKPIIVDTYDYDDYILTPESLRKALESNSKVSCLILCNPSNPTGSVANKSQLEAIAKVLDDYPNVVIISDEIYERLTYDNIKHISFASLNSNIYEKTITINGFSKSYAMTGYRIGYSASTLLLSKNISKLQSQITSCANSIGQYAALKGLTDTSEVWFTKRNIELQIKRNIAYNMLYTIPNISCPKPTGAFYLLPNISAYFGLKTLNGKQITNSHELCLELLREKQVALVSGDAFGANNCVRISYATSEDIIIKSIDKLKEFLLSLH